MYYERLRAPQPMNYIETAAAAGGNQLMLLQGHVGHAPLVVLPWLDKWTSKQLNYDVVPLFPISQRMCNCKWAVKLKVA